MAVPKEYSAEPVLRTAVGLVLCVLILIIGFPALIILGAILWIVRQVLTLVKKVMHPSYGDFTGGIASLFAAEDPYSVTETSIGVHMIFEGRVGLEKMRETVASRLKALETDGIYPELKQQLSSWAGFSLWVPDTSFNIENHVKVMTGSNLRNYTGYSAVTDENIAQVTRTMLSVPYTLRASPWDIHLCYDLESTTTKNPEGATVIFFRFHHSLGDALSVMKLVYLFTEEIHDGKDTREMMEKGEIKLKKSLAETIVYGLTFLLAAAYDLGMFAANATDFNSWHRPSTPSRSKYNYVNFPVSSERVKRIRQLRKTSFFGVLCAAQTGAIRKFMRERQEEVPKEMHAVVSVPFPSSKTSLSNDITFVALTFPTGENDRRKVLRVIDNSFSSAKSSRYPMLMMFAFRVVGMVPQGILSKFGWIFTTCATTNFPASQTPIACHGIPCCFAGALSSLPSNVAMYSWAVGYNGTTAMAVGFSSDIVQDRASASKMLEFLEEEFEGLEDPKNNTILQPIPTNFRPIKNKDN